MCAVTTVLPHPNIVLALCLFEVTVPSHSPSWDTTETGRNGANEFELTSLRSRFEKEPQFSTSVFLSSSADVSPTDRKPNKGFGDHRKAMAILGHDDPGNIPNKPPTQVRTNHSILPWDNTLQSQNGEYDSNLSPIAPWDSHSQSNNTISPGDSKPNPQMASRLPGQSYLVNESNEHVGQPSPSLPPPHSRTGTSDASDLGFDDQRRPSVASANTVSSQGSKASTGGRFHKRLKGIFGDEYGQQPDSRKTSETSLPSQKQTGKDSSTSRDRNASVNSEKTIEAPSRPHTPVASSDVTPWAYQNFDVSRTSTYAPLEFVCPFSFSP